MENLITKYDLLNEVYADAELSKMAKTIFQYLVYKSNNSVTWVSNDTIAAAVNCTKRYVQMNMRKLEIAGYIIRESRYYNHQQLSNFYKFNLMPGKKVVKDIEADDIREQYNTFFSNKGKVQPFKKVDLMKNIYNSNMHKNEKAVLSYIVSKINKSGIAYNNIYNISKDLHMTINWIRNILIKLQARNLLIIKTSRENMLYGFKVCVATLCSLLSDQKVVDGIEPGNNKNVKVEDKCECQIKADIDDEHVIINKDKNTDKNLIYSCNEDRSVDTVFNKIRTFNRGVIGSIKCSMRLFIRNVSRKLARYIS